MQNQHLAFAGRLRLSRALRIVSASLLTLWMAGCAQQPSSELASGSEQSPDIPGADAPDGKTADAGGVSGSFQVATFALQSEPTISFGIPAPEQTFQIAANGTTTINAQIDGNNIDPISMTGRCYLNGGFVGLVDSNTGTISFANVPKGYHTLACVVTTPEGTEFTNAGARATVRVKVVQPCSAIADCEDGLACTNHNCVSGSCTYGAIQYCCGSKYDCTGDQQCLNANTTQSKCATCETNLDCDDGDSCTTDMCDASSGSGKCTNIKANKECCSLANDPCSDGKSCTVDSCNLATGTCEHVLPEGTCCADTDCVASDPCLTGNCLDGECRYGPSGFRPGCCSPGNNPTCNDNNPCTIDACATNMGSWMQCVNTPDPDKPGCCNQAAGNTPECNDGQFCTADYCEDYQCKNIEIMGCCAATVDCDDNNVCTNEVCDIQNKKCIYDKVPGCCNSNIDCNDGKSCTADTCNYAINTCSNVKVYELCCDTNDECDDGKSCTQDLCINLSCVHGKTGFDPLCCDDNSMCNDFDPCTIDACDTDAKKCTFTPNGDPLCCAANIQCDDGDCTTQDFCNAANLCEYKPAPGSCKFDIDCDDGQPCTADSCSIVNGCGTCKNETIAAPACCVSDFDCNDSKTNPNGACTQDKCVNNVCEYSPKADCCLNDADALTACDDGNSCTIEYCLANSCRHTTPKGGCCTATADCNDNDECTIDACNNIVDGKGVCANQFQEGCSGCNPTNAFTFDDGNSCTADSCVEYQPGKFQDIHTAIEGCCLDKFDCDDGKPCTYDYCLFNICVHSDNEGGETLCCSPETEAVDCAYLNDSCTVGKCNAQPDGSFACEATEKQPCTVELGYCQDFESDTSLSKLGWLPADLTGSASTNWSVSTNGPLGPDQFARFNWTPTKTNYYTCIQSPIIQAAGAGTISLQFDRALLPNGGQTVLNVLGSLDGAEVDWDDPSSAIVIDALPSANNVGPETVTFELPPQLTGSNGLRIAMCVQGSTTADLEQFAVDNICIVRGSAPYAVQCPPNQQVLVGGTKIVPIKVRDDDFSDIVSFQLIDAPSFVTISTSMYYWLDTSWNSAITIKPTQVNQIGEHTITVRYTDGKLFGTCQFTINVTYEDGYLIWAPSEVGDASADAILAGLTANGAFGQKIRSLELYPSLTKFDGVFITLGVYPNNHVLQETEVASLKLYLAAGGRVYMEGADTFYWDQKTTLHPFFKIKGLTDGSSNGVEGPLKGFAAYADISINPTKHFDWAFSTEPEFNSLNDLIEAANVAGARNILRNDAPAEKFWVQVGYDDTAVGYRTIGSSIPFAGVLAGTDNPNAMIGRILEFFANGFAPCTEAADCDDGNSCTADVCGTDGKCTSTNSCLCSANSALDCGDSFAALSSNGGSASQNVVTYSCDPASYLGKETAYAYTPTSSAPVTVTLTNVSNPTARIFILRAAGNGCDPDTCVATGATEVTFAGAAGQQYFIVIDVPAEDGFTQFDIAVSCGAGEDCENGVDDNSNGLADCIDAGSCCGHASCQIESCNGYDDNCDGNIDEGCDDDGDGYCDAGLQLIGTPAICPLGGGDCADNDGTVNTGAQEICGNNKDDNCNSAQDEPNAAGCQQFFADFDADTFGTGAPACLCAATGAFTASQGGDCNDGKPSVNPSATETCSTSDDDNCSGSNNDLNAQGCTNFYTDVDADMYGVAPFQCRCTGQGEITAPSPGDCNDNNSGINPGLTEVCNNVDDNCNGQIDEGCDDDGDDYCDADLAYSQSGPNAPDICPKGPGDTNDADPEVNPEGQEICDDKDNDSDGQVDEDCDKDNDNYCDVAMFTLGTPSTCTGGGGDCADTEANINPGRAEDCTTAFDDNCNGSANDQNAVECTPYFFDADNDNWGTTSFRCHCVPVGQYKAQNPGDCNDDDDDQNPGATEICDGFDNDCDKFADDGCDKDGDAYCDAGATLIGSPAICPNGGGDCNDFSALVNPGKAEVCGNGVDDNCNSSQNDVDAVGCTFFYPDGDNDTFGAGLKRCQCVASVSHSSTNNADCNDATSAINPSVMERCDDVDNDCDGSTDEGCDDDNDNYCDSMMQVVGTPSTCTAGGGDCQDNLPLVFPAANAEICDNLDNNCNGQIDDGCDDDQDGYCDAASAVVSPAPTICPNGGGDCDDLNNQRNPGVSELCGNGVDDNCNGSQNDTNAAGCSPYYYDADGDGFGLSLELCLCAAQGQFTATKAGDCADNVAAVNPNGSEVCDNGVDNDCDGEADEAGSTGCTEYFYDEDQDGFGLALKSCICAPTAPYTAVVSGDCNDTSAQIKPGLVEKCDNQDNDCDAQVDEGCNKDGDQYCDGTMQVVGTPNACALGGGDCNDNDAGVSPSANEVCNSKDDNCNTSVDEGCDDDNDDYCDSNMTLVGSAATCTKGSGDCNDTAAGINPGAAELCGNTTDENCSGGYNDQNATGCQFYYVDFDGDTYGKGGSSFQKAVINEFRRGSTALTTTGNEYIEILFTADVTQNDLNSLYIGDSQSGTTSKLGAFRLNLTALGINELKAGTIVTIGGSNLGQAQDTSYNPQGGDWNLTFYTNSSYVTTDATGADIAADDMIWIDTVRTGTSNIDSIRWGGTAGALGLQAKVVLSSVPANWSSGLPSGVVAFTGDMSQLNQAAFYSVNATGSVGQPNGGGNTSLVNLLRNLALNGDSKCLCAPDGAYSTLQGGDCDDSNNQVYAAAMELCDGEDNNCSGVIDEGCDNDNDGYCDSAMTSVGSPAICPNGGGDCNDTNAAINPGATEVCGGTVDENCDGALNSTGGTGCTDFYLDSDNDGWGVNVKLCLCAPTGGYKVTQVGDCDDSNANVNPTKAEVCGDGLDNDCDGTQNDLNASGCSSFYTDADLDGYGTGTAQCRCFAEGTAVATAAGDCNDTDANINPGYTEICDDKDNNCNASSPVVDVSITTTGGTNSLGNHIAQTFKPTMNGTFQSFTVRLTGGTGNQTVSAFLYKGGNPVSGGTLQETLPTFSVTGSAPVANYVINSVSKPTFASGEVWTLVLKASGSGMNWHRSTATTTYADGFGGFSSTGLTGTYTTATGDFYLVVSVNPTGGTIDEGCNVDGDAYCTAARPTVGKPSICAQGGGDCNDSAAAVFPGATELCDNLDNNCSASTDEECDADGDQYCSALKTSVGTPAVCPLGTNDCDDTNKDISPGKTEMCDNFDNDCDASTDEGCDVDNDNYCTSSMNTVGAPTTCTAGGGDCNDGNAAINPGVTDNCDGIDNNCVAGIDESCRDTDGDGYCNGTAVAGPGCPSGGGDCNDSDALVNPGRTETCATAYDDNCDGQTNSVGATGCVAWYTDADADGYGGPTSNCLCTQNATFKVTVAGDCADNNDKINPAALEICDGINNDCAGTPAVDTGCDDDADNYCDANMLIAATAQCSASAKPASGQTKSGDDCNDSSNTVNFAAAELCDNVDNNCNGVIDDGCDDDNDNFCEAGKTIVGTPATCAAGGDCNDDNTAVKPGPATTENCATAYDDNCDGGLDAVNAVGCTNFYLDADGDSYGTSAFECRCSPNGQYNATRAGDCNDSDPAQNSVTQAEVCDGKDNNCNGTTDENCDKDLDGYCDALLTVTSTFACPNTTLKVAAPFTGDDCDDGNKLTFPGAVERCDNIDNSCSAGTDEGCDDDNDNYCDAAMITVGAPTTCTAGGGDCQDANGAVRPNAPEVCNNSIDDNCNLVQNEAGASGCTVWYFDGDQDGCAINSSQCLCAADGKFNRSSFCGGVADCNDSCFTCNPNQTDVATNLERFCDGLNNDCDGSVDEGCNDDGDPYCDGGTTTVGTPSICNKGGGDCNDGAGTVYPTANEACNNADDNCNGSVDENASANCTASQAQTACVAGTCAITSCSTGYFNINGSFGDGCECNGRDGYEPNDTPATSRNVSSAVGEGANFTISGLMVDSSDVDYYHFLAVDAGDSGVGVCDQFAVRVYIETNPNGWYAFEVMRNNPNVGAAADVCCNDTDFHWFTRLKASRGQVSQIYSEFGQCPCSSASTFDQVTAWWSQGPGVGGPYGRGNAAGYNTTGGMGGEPSYYSAANGYALPYAAPNPAAGSSVWGMGGAGNGNNIALGWDYTRCRDESAWFYVRVFKQAGGLNCSPYTLRIQNGAPAWSDGYAGYRDN